MEEDDWNPEGLAEKVIHVDWWTSAVLWIWSCSHFKAEGYRLDMYIYIHCIFIYIFLKIYIHICTHNLVIGAVELSWIPLPSAAHEWAVHHCFALDQDGDLSLSPNGQDRESHRKGSINQAPYQKKYEAASKTYEEVPLAFWMGSRCVWSFHDL